MRFRLRTLLILLLILPPLLAGGWKQYKRWQSHQRLIELGRVARNY